MMKQILIVVALGACATQDNSTPLAQLSSTYGATRIEVVAKSQLNIVLHVDYSGSGACPMLAEDVTATFDGMQMSVARGGYDLDSTGCYPIAFYYVSQLPMDQINAYERTTSNSQLEVKDKSATWGVNSSGKLFANDFVDEPANARVIWTDVTQISTVSVSPVVHTTIEGNIVHYPAGTHLDWISAHANPTASKCDGPAVCLIDLQGERALGPINP